MLIDRWGECNAARGLISRDIANIYIYYSYSLKMQYKGTNTLYSFSYFEPKSCTNDG